MDAPPPAPRAPIQYDDERIAWDACNASKTLGACQAYVAKYPAGRWIENARAKIADFALEEKERAVWTQCQSGSTAAACETYLSAYPTGRWGVRFGGRV